MRHPAAEASPPAATQCPVAALALGSQELVDAMDASDEAKRATPPHDTRTRLKHQQRHDDIFDLIAWRKLQAVTTPAASADGALHQLAIATAIVEELYELTPEADANHADWRRAKELNSLFRWAAYSVAGVLKRASSAPREKLCVELYMPERDDPFAVTALPEGKQAAHPSLGHSSHDAEGDIGNLTTLLDMLVDEECGLVRTDMSPAQVEALARISALAWTARDLARRIDADLNGPAAASAHKLGAQQHACAAE